jgi:hypothetical protein
MTHSPFKAIFASAFLIASLLSVSCSKDSDLLAEYVATDPIGNIDLKVYVVDDTFSTTPNSTVVLDVLANDTFTDPNNVKIVETSIPANGIVEINENKTLTYIAGPENTVPTEETDAVTDTFTYTTETVTENNTVVTEQATVTVTISEEITYWKNKFDQGWSYYAADMDKLGSSANRNQEYYFYAYYIDGITNLWQATGDNTYLDRVIAMIDRTINDAVPMGNGYLGWPSAEGEQVPLWDSFYWRVVSTLTRIMHQSPNLRTNQKYQEAYIRFLNFSEKNMWERYEGTAWHFYRVNTHMASHWARIGMELYIITGKQKYKEVFDNISFGTMINQPSNLRNQLRSNPNVPTAYVWSSGWNGGGAQDTSHGAQIVSFWNLAYENEMYWNKADIDALVATFTKVVCPGELTQGKEYVDGSGGTNTQYTWLHEWLVLGRYSPEIQAKIKSYYDKNTYLGYVGLQPIGIAALNARILADGRPVYPENF